MHKWGKREHAGSEGLITTPSSPVLSLCAPRYQLIHCPKSFGFPRLRTMVPSKSQKNRYESPGSFWPSGGELTQTKTKVRKYHSQQGRSGLCLEWCLPSEPTEEDEQEDHKGHLSLRDGGPGGWASVWASSCNSGDFAQDRAKCQSPPQEPAPPLRPM